jgi:tellurite methyltransferase
MGRGRDVIYFARRGFRVSGVDLSPAGPAKANRRATRLRTRIHTEVADLRTYRLPGKFDVVFSSSALNHLPPAVRRRRFASFRAATSPGGIHAVNAFVPTPGLPALPDMEPDAYPFRPGELRGYYRDWSILENREFGFDCPFGGFPHRHSMEVVVARSPGGPARPRSAAKRPAGP